MRIDWKIIKERYSKTFEEIVKWDIDRNSIYDVIEHKEEDLNTFCYCDLVNFFDKQGIIIDISLFPVLFNDAPKKHDLMYNFSIWHNEEWFYNSNDHAHTEYSTSREEAQFKVIPKAFELSEAQLNK